MKTKLLIWLVVLVAAGVARADIFDTFNNDNGGWSIVSYPFRGHSPDPQMTPAVFDGAFGNPPGSLRIGDIYSETGVAAPAAYLGDMSSHYGEPLHYDILVRYADVVDTYPAVVLNGGTLSLYFDAPPPEVGQWETRTVELTEAGWRRSDTDELVDEATFRSILANLVGLYIYTEWHTGEDDTSFDNVRVGNGTIGAGDLPGRGIVLNPCHPNPFNPQTVLSFVLPEEGSVTLEIFDLQGARLAIVADRTYPAGSHEVIWDGRDEQGRGLPSGNYLARLRAGGTEASTKLLLVR